LAITPTEPSRPTYLQPLLVANSSRASRTCVASYDRVVGVTERRAVVERDLGVEGVDAPTGVRSTGLISIEVASPSVLRAGRA